MKTATKTTSTGQFPAQLRVSPNVKFAIQVLALVAFVTFAARNVRGQGTVNFSLHVAGVHSVRVYMPDTTYGSWPTFGNTSNQIPAGMQSYSGALASGPNFVAQLWAAPGANQPESTLQLASETRTFRSGAAAGLVPGGTAVLTNVPPDCPVATVQVRVWQPSPYGQPIQTWQQALYSIPGNVLGKSLPFNVEAISGGTNPLPNLLNLQSFSLITNYFDSPARPVIYVQPQHQAVSPGGSVTFRAESSLPANKPVSWRFNGSNIVSGWAGSQPLTNGFVFPMLPNAGGTLVQLPSTDFFFGFPETNLLQLTNVQLSQAGIYSLVVSNYCCFFPGFQPPFTVSSNAVLTVGNPGTLTVSADGSSQVVLNWDGVFFLQTATNATGPFTDLPGPIVFGPYANSEANGSRFFRLRN